MDGELTIFDPISQKEYIQVDHLINMLRILQYERYATQAYEKEYACIESVIDGIQHAIECYNEGGYDV